VTEKNYRNIIFKYGGAISDPGCCVDFPDTLRITTKSEALDLLDIMIHDVHPPRTYTVSLDPLFRALRAAVKKGLE